MYIYICMYMYICERLSVGPQTLNPNNPCPSEQGEEVRYSPGLRVPAVTPTPPDPKPINP